MEYEEDTYGDFVPLYSFHSYNNTTPKVVDLIRSMLDRSRAPDFSESEIWDPHLAMGHGPLLLM